MLHRTRTLAVSIFITLLTACGGGGGGGGTPPPTPNADPTGFYDTSAGTTLNNVAVTDLQGVIHNNRLMMLSATTGLSYDGSITVSGNDYSGTLSAYQDGTFLGTPTVVGTISQGTSVSGALTGAGSGSFQLFYAANNGEASTLSAVGGNTNINWSAKIGGSMFPFRMTIDTTGSIVDDALTTEGVFRECGMAGSITPIAGTHLYMVNVTLSRCHATTAAAEGAYSGLASKHARAPAATVDKLFFSVTNGTYSASNEFTCDLSAC